MGGCGGRPQAPTERLYQPVGNLEVQFTIDSRMGASFEFDDLRLSLDHESALGAATRDRIRTSVRAGTRATWGTKVTPGDHLLQALVMYSGTTAQNKYQIRSSRTFNANETAEVVLIAYEAADRPLEERPAVRYEEHARPRPPTPPGSTACSIHLRDDLAKRFALRRVDVLVDRKSLLTQQQSDAIVEHSTDGLDANVSSDLTAGDHELTVTVDAEGLAADVKGDRRRVSGTRWVTATIGKRIDLTVMVHEPSDLALRFLLRIENVK